MTQRIAFFLFMIVALSYACNKVDNALLGRVEEHVQTFTKANGDLQNAAAEIGEVQNIMSKAPVTVLKDTAELPQLKERLQMISNRVSVRSVEYSDILKKLQETALGYRTGKLTTEQVNREIELFGERLNGVPDFTKGISQGISDIKVRVLRLTGDSQPQ